jgi:hypothetical protein
MKCNRESPELEQSSEDYKKQSVEEYGRRKRIFLYGKAFLPFLISHHPECTYFKGHTIEYKKFKLCIGCFVGYPTAIISITIINIIKIHEVIPLGIIFFLSIILLSTFILSLLNLIKNKKIKIIQKALIGIGAALLIHWIMLLPNTISINFIISIFTVNILLIIFNLYHVYGIWSVCYNCEYSFNWGVCPGFNSIRCRMKNYNLPNFLLNLAPYSRKIENKKKENSISRIRTN